MWNLSASDKIQALKAQIAALEQQELTELKERRTALSTELASVDAELARVTGQPTEGKKKRATTGPGLSLPLQELKDLLAEAPGKTVNIRKANLELANIKTLAAATPHLLSIGGHGPWPTVTLLK